MEETVWYRERVKAGEYAWKEYIPQYAKLTGQVELWSPLKRFFVDVLDKKTGEMITIPVVKQPALKRIVSRTSIVFSETRDRFEVR